MSSTISRPYQRQLVSIIAIDYVFWLFLLALYIIGQLLAATQHINVVPDPIFVELALSFMLVAISLRLAKLDDRSVALALEGYGAFFAAIVATAPLAYVVTRSPMPAIDLPIIRMETFIGFDPIRWRAAVFSRPILRTVAIWAYGSFFPQYLLALTVLPRTSHPRRGLELMRMSVLTICLSYVVAFLLPTIGTIPAVESWTNAWHVLHDSRAPFDAGDQILPIISLPSYHAAMAVMLSYSMWGLGLLSRLMVCLNIVMLLVTPVMGSHHLTDVAAGTALAVVSILIIRKNAPPGA